MAEDVKAHITGVVFQITSEAYRQFRGRDPDVTALLKRRGFPTN